MHIIQISIIVSRGSKRWSPFLLGEESNGNVIAIRASESHETNGEWNLSVPESAITSEFPNGNLNSTSKEIINFDNKHFCPNFFRKIQNCGHD